MTTSKRRRESAWKSRKQQAQHPHDKGPSLHELAHNAGQSDDGESGAPLL
ncbi:DUF6254 family protein [Cohnella sp. REN36]|nr:DUF6254 family protein [Cohnella sp. REN36]